MKTLLGFLAGFFKQGTSESSARLVGIASCFTGLTILLFSKRSPSDIAAASTALANGLIALGLRKTPTGETVVEETTVAASATTTVVSTETKS